MKAGDFMPECYVTKREYQLVCPTVTWGGGRNDNCFRYVLFE